VEEEDHRITKPPLVTYHGGGRRDLRFQAGVPGHEQRTGRD
jgi:hypothetical protein